MNKEYLYSPWRLEYIQSEKPGDCILCRHKLPSSDDDNLIIYRGNYCYVMLNRYPYNNGHIMLVPYEHCGSLSALSTSVLTELFSLLQVSEQVLANVYSCNGINIGINLGKAAGAGIEEHLHIHMVPRWNGDCNFMSIIAGQRVIPEAFELSLSKLRQEYGKLLPNKD